ncbi:ribosomal protein S5 domain 2-type protein [Myxozyma melibiosi]|uniref:Small ribosomal subunit protein uS9m n=1 Tax=Myxozyma melibiosi TaxID=54550 RepID=A0ABR1FET3_9ASCO
MNQEMEDEEMFHEAMEAIDTGDVLEDPEESAELSAMDDDLWNLDASKIGEPHTKEEFANIFEPFPNELQVDDQVAPLVRVVPESSAFYMQNMEYMEILVSLKALERKYKHLARLPEAWRIFQPISQKEYLEMGISDKPITYHEFMGLIRNLASIRPDVMPAEVEALVSRFARNYLKAKVDKREPKVDKMGRSFGKGKRKESIARVWIVKGRGDVLINGKTLADTFVRVQERERVAAPLRATGMLDEYNVFALVEGGGKSGQAGALQLGLSRALRAYNPGLGKILYDTGYLKMDLRRVERKKPGKRKARKSEQWVKR